MTKILQSSKCIIAAMVSYSDKVLFFENPNYFSNKTTSEIISSSPHSCSDRMLQHDEIIYNSYTLLRLLGAS